MTRQYAKEPNCSVPGHCADYQNRNARYNYPESFGLSSQFGNMDISTLDKQSTTYSDDSSTETCQRTILEHKSSLLKVPCDTSLLTSPAMEAVRTMVPNATGDPDLILELAAKLFTAENHVFPDAKQLFTCLDECDFNENNIVTRFIRLSSVSSKYDSKTGNEARCDLKNSCHNQLTESEMLSYKVTALQSEHDFLTKMTKCILCKSRPREVTFLPCGHFSLCSACADTVSVCPIENCQKEALAEIRTFLG